MALAWRSLHGVAVNLSARAAVCSHLKARLGLDDLFARWLMAEALVLYHMDLPEDCLVSS